MFTRTLQPVEHGDLRLTVLEAKSTVRIGEPYDMRCRLTNSSERSMDLHLALNTIAKLGCGYTGASEFMVSAVIVCVRVCGCGLRMRLSVCAASQLAAEWNTSLGRRTPSRDAPCTPNA